MKNMASCSNKRLNLAHFSLEDEPFIFCQASDLVSFLQVVGLYLYVD